MKSGKKHLRQKKKELQFRTGISYVWLVEYVENQTLCMERFKQRLIDYCKQDWCSAIAESGKAILNMPH